MKATDKDIRNQANFCNTLMDRLLNSIAEGKTIKYTCVKEDIKRLRKELNHLSHMCEWDYDPSWF